MERSKQLVIYKENIQTDLKKIFILPVTSMLMLAGCDTKNPAGGGPIPGPPPAPMDIVLHDVFTEDFTEETSSYLNYGYRASRDDFRYFPGVPSLSERQTDIMMLRIDPADAAGITRGAEIISKDHTFYGTYSVRLRLPDIRKAQPHAGIVTGCSVYGCDDAHGLREIYMEWLAADPTLVYAGIRTGTEAKPYETGKVLRVADSVKGFDASKKFYTYGFDWNPEGITWWVIDPEDNGMTELWTLDSGDVPGDGQVAGGIPAVPGRYRLNYWHSKLKAAENIPASTEAPKYPYELEIDRISYRPSAGTGMHRQEKHAGR